MINIICQYKFYEVDSNKNYNKNNTKDLITGEFASSYSLIVYNDIQHYWVLMFI